jgi:hypothetical protein
VKNTDFIYNNERLTVVDEFQYLGTIFSRKGNFGRNKARLVQQARKAIFYVLRKARKWSLPIDILLQLFDAMVAPILLYGAEVWGYEKNDIFETLHLEFCPFFFQNKDDITYGSLHLITFTQKQTYLFISFDEVTSKTVFTYRSIPIGLG